MGTSRNTGQDNSLVVYGNPESFKKLIKNHGQMCKIKQSLFCPCVGANNGSPKLHCTVCGGTGFVYTYQRRFMIADEYTQTNKNVTEFYPYYIPIMEVVKVERIISEKQGGIKQMEVDHFDDETIYVKNPDNDVKDYEKKRVTYFCDGWTKIEGDILRVDETFGYMWATKTFVNLGYQSSNPLNAEADICQMLRVYNFVTGEEIPESDYERIGNMIKTKREIKSGQMKADYYYSDLTQIITADLKTKDELNKSTNDMVTGDIRLALFPWWNLSKGDIIVIAADAQFRTELLNHTSDMDRLWEMEIFELNDVIMDELGNTYLKEEDYTQEGRYVRWISDKKPKDNAIISVRYGYKPAFICFEDNPEPNNLENKRYPKIIYAKSWTKTSSDDIRKLVFER